MIVQGSPEVFGFQEIGQVVFFSGGKFPEINGRELASLAPLAALVLVLGFWPRPLLNLIDQGSLAVHRLVDRPGQAQIAQAPRGQPPNALALEAPGKDGERR